MCRGLRFRFGLFELDCDSGELRKGGLRIRLEDQPTRLLAALVARPGQVLTREELKTLLWPTESYGDFDRGLTRAINKVRSALNDSAANPHFIETLPRRGYRFIAPAEQMEVPSASLGPNNAHLETNTPGVVSSSEPFPPPTAAGGGPSVATFPVRSRRTLWQLAVILTITIASVTILFFVRPWRDRDAALVVLPFQSSSPDPAGRYLAGGVADQLRAELSRIASLRVVSRDAGRRYKDHTGRTSQIARDLNVATIVAGMVTQTADRVRVTVELIRPPNEKATWAKTYESGIKGLQNLQLQMVQEVTAQIGVSIRRAEKQRLASALRASDPDLHVMYLKGRFLALEPDRDLINRGIQLLEDVVTKDPAHVPAYVALAEAWFQLSSSYLPPAVAMPKAKAAARKAIGLSPDSAEAHATLGRIHVFYDWDWQAAEEQLQKALELNPNSSMAYRGLGCLRMATGRIDEALNAAEHGLRLDPMSLWMRFDHVWLLLVGRRYDEAIRQARRNLEWEPSFGLQRALLGVVHGEKRNYTEGVRELEIAVQAQRIPTSLAFLAHGYALAGRREDAEKILVELISFSKDKYVCRYEVASAYATLGRVDDAFNWMQKAVDARADCLVWLRSEPWLEILRRDPRYTALLHKVGLPGT